ncbi:MAG: hypothetical protein JSV16_16275 [Candidatus Hydrogenedentota bacterium]|nr:MAG: hypothetical protein JSV16_16275 [Candidatus Hydrogenedentota bacterium]
MKHKCVECKKTITLKNGMTHCPKCEAPLPEELTLKGESAQALCLQSARETIDAYHRFTRNARRLQAVADSLLEQARVTLSQFLNHAQFGQVDTSRIGDFLTEPFLIEQIGTHDYIIHIPQFLNTHVGWLTKQTRAFRSYRVNIYSLLGSEGVPEWLKQYIRLPEPPRVQIEDNTYLRVDWPVSKVYEVFWNLVDGPDAKGRYAIRGPEQLFLVRAALIRHGLLLQQYNSVAEGILKPVPKGMSLRSYQQRAFGEFLKWGRVCVFFPPQSGKSYLGLYAALRLDVPSLIIVPTKLLKQQWEAQLFQHGVEDACVETYHVATTSRIYTEFSRYPLVIFDECQSLPAYVFRRLACLKNTYTLGLSASPFRGDNQEALIYALTGKPVFCDWSEYFEHIAAVRPHIKVIVCEGEAQRRIEVVRLAKQKKGRTLVYVEHIKLGEILSEALGAPFYYHRNQPTGPESFGQNDTMIVSRLDDGWLGLGGVRRVIVAESIGDSRRQDIQRLGRLLANTEGAEYLVVLTRDEHQQRRRKTDEILSSEGFLVEELQASSTANDSAEQVAETEK